MTNMTQEEKELQVVAKRYYQCFLEDENSIYITSKYNAETEHVEIIFKNKLNDRKYYKAVISMETFREVKKYMCNI